MELPTRWIKVFKDIWSNKSRTMLVILSIAVGVASVGMTINGGRIIERDMNVPYRATNPSSTTLTITPFDDHLVWAVEATREIDQAEARRVEIASVIRDGRPPMDIALNVVPDYQNVRINTFSIEQGNSEPGKREILLERQAAAMFGVSVGDTLTIGLPNIKQTYTLTVSGIVYDMHFIPPWMFNQAGGYVSMDTLAWMGLGRAYNSLEIIVAGDKTSRENIWQAATSVRDHVIEPAGYRVIGIKPLLSTAATPGDHYAAGDISGMILIVNVIGVMSILLTIGLVINTISALVVRQVQQIGIIRSIGGQRRQIIWMYIGNVLVLALCALVIAIPVGLLGAAGMVTMIANIINFDVTRIDLPLNILLLQVGIGLAVPLAAALFPILGGTQISVYDAIYQHGLMGAARVGGIERLLVRLRGLTTPLILSVRNTFRRKTRLIFTLVTLTLAGATFIAALSTYTSLLEKFDSIIYYWLYDVSIAVPDVACPTAEREALRVGGVEVAEGWMSSLAIFVYPDGSESEQVELMAIPSGAQTVDAQMVAGRWPVPGDTNVVVASFDTLSRVSGVEIGKEVTLRIQGIERRYRIIGITSSHLYGARLYMSQEYFGKTYGTGDRVNLVRVQAQRGGVSTGAVQDALSMQMDQHFKNIGWTVKTDVQHTMIENARSSSQVILSILLLLSGMLAVVGGLGLAGTMSLNVLERTREIGVLRAVGATDGAVRRLVLIEGLAVALMSWVLSIALAYPLGMGLANAVATATLQTTLDFVFSTQGILAWLALVLVIATAASIAPAQGASRLTVREVLAYE
ncbi:MAG: FtsX-like permease family protein [Anaerolineae bacterium]|nr:FtsX-like permease family protein [Anaerolineae bacterium]